MRVPRLGLLAPVLLVGLVGLLGTLQYRWLGKVSEAEREEMRRVLDQRASEFANDFDGEIARIYLALQPRLSEAGTPDWDAVTAGYQAWLGSARFPRMVRAIYLAEGEGERRTLRRYDPAAPRFAVPVDAWPPHLQAVRNQLVGHALPPLTAPGAKGQILSFTIGPAVPEVPALLIPVPQIVRLRSPAVPGYATTPRGGPPTPIAGFQAGFFPRWPASYVIVDLDGEYLRGTLVPSLVARHFPDQGSGGYRVAVLSGSGSPIFLRGMTPGTVNAADADVVAPFFNLRLDILRGEGVDRENVTFRARVDGPEGASQGEAAGGDRRVAVVVEHRAGRAMTDAGTRTNRFQVSHASWQLVLRHPSGSLGAAVMEARRRNLWLGFGILAVLAAGVVLVVGNARRAKQLATNQMDFVATVSHELRTPLTVIRSAGQNLVAGVVSDPTQTRKYGELIEDEGRRLTEMVEQILEYARVRGDRPLRDPRPVDTTRLVNEIAGSYAPECAMAGVVLEVHVPPDGLPDVVGEETGLRRAVGNLVANALRHAAAGGWIGMRATVASVRGRLEVSIAVADRGPGIDPADLPRVFEPFYRGRRAVDGQVRGNGLGLSLVKRVTEAHGGRVTVKTAVGEGSTVTIHLPAAAGALAAAEGAQGAHEAAGSSGSPA